jgi:hypothetical protein
MVTTRLDLDRIRAARQMIDPMWILTGVGLLKMMMMMVVSRVGVTA